MKNRKLLVRVSCTTKKFYLSPPPPGSNDWHIRFTPPRKVRDKLKIRERIYRTTGKAEIEPAKMVARQMIESYWNADAVESVKQRDGFAKLSEIVERYRDGARTVTDKEELAESTIGKNVTSLIRIVETRFTDAGEKRAAGSWETLTANVLTTELLEDFKRGWLRNVDHNDLQAMSSAKHTVNAYIRQARSIFAPAYMPLYADLELPDLSGFRAVQLFKIPVSATRFVAIPPAQGQALETQIKSLRNERPDIYLAFYFALWLGMRVKDICSARLEWIERAQIIRDGRLQTIARMEICRRRYYKPKGIKRSLPIAPSLLADITELSIAREPMDYLIPSTNIQGRTIRNLSAIIRRHLGYDRRKTNHELRKQGISVMLAITKNWPDTAQFSGHSDVRTLRNHYEDFLDPVPPITSSNWRDIA